LGKYIIKKIGYGLLVLWGVVTLVFFLQAAVGGNPALLMGGNHATVEDIEKIEKELRINDPIYVRYLAYLNDLSPISFHSQNPEDISFNKIETKRDENDEEVAIFKYSGYELMNFGETTVMLKSPYLGRTFDANRTHVSEIIFSKLPSTFILALAAVAIAFVVGVFIGVFAAMNKGSFFDNSSFMVAIAGMSTPSFFMAAIVSNVFGFLWSEESQLPIFPLVTMIFAAIVGVVYFFTKNAQKDVTLRKSFNWKLILKWAGQGFFAGIILWLIYIVLASVFGWEYIPLIGDTVIGPGTGLEPTGTLVMIDDYTAEEYYEWNNLIMPAITLGIRPLAIVAQLTRSSMLDVLSEDYIRTAKAKGLPQWKIITKHALKNALNPVVTAVSGTFASLLAGSVFIENIFSWNGIGSTLLDALNDNNLPLILGITIFVSAFFVVINVLVDIVYGFLDPRIRLKD